MEIHHENRNGEELVLEQEASGLTQNEICQQRGIKIDAFKYHRAKHKSKNNLNSNRSFVELKTSKTSEEISLNSKNALAFRLNFEIKDWLKLEIQLG